jgi:hypothetical protein
VFLTVANNKIKKLHGLNGCNNLKLLDASCNAIEELHDCTLPIGLAYLSLTSNPCTKDASYRYNIISKLPNLVELDDVEVSRFEKLMAARSPLEMIPEAEEEDNDDHPKPIPASEDYYSSRISDAISRSRQRFSMDTKTTQKYKDLIDQSLKSRKDFINSISNKK